MQPEQRDVWLTAGTATTVTTGALYNYAHNTIMWRQYPTGTFMTNTITTPEQGVPDSMTSLEVEDLTVDGARIEDTTITAIDENPEPEPTDETEETAEEQPTTMFVWRRKPRNHNHVGQGTRNGYGQQVRANVNGYCELCRYTAGLPPVAMSDNVNEVPYDANIARLNDTDVDFYRPGDFVRIGKSGQPMCVAWVIPHQEVITGNGDNHGKMVNCLKPNHRQVNVGADRLVRVDETRVQNALPMMREAMRLAQQRYDLLSNEARRRAIGHWRGGSSICTAGLEDWLASCELKPLRQRVTTTVRAEGMQFEIPQISYVEAASHEMQRVLARARIVFDERDSDVRIISGPIGSIHRMAEYLGVSLDDEQVTAMTIERRQREDQQNFPHNDYEAAINYINNRDRERGNVRNPLDYRMRASSSFSEDAARADADANRNPWHMQPVAT